MGPERTDQEAEHLNGQFLAMMAHLKVLAEQVMDERALAAFERTLEVERGFVYEYFLNASEVSSIRREASRSHESR